MIRSPSRPNTAPVRTPQKPMPVKPMSSPDRIAMMVTIPNFLARTAKSIKGIPVISVHSAPRTGRKIGTKPMGMATQQPSTK